MRPLLVGESNPYGSNPEFALYPLPERSAGGRLCRLVLGMRMAEYLRAYDRANLCDGRWSAPTARAEALGCPPHGRPDRALGARVAAAFALDFEPFTARQQRIVGDGAAWSATLVVLPHPSGLCRLWNEPGAFERARAVLRVAGCPVGGAQ